MQCSLIIPAYNAAGTLETCLKSALNQTFPPEQYEVLVVDDGSVDQTAAIAARFPVRLVQQANRGPAAARNAGARCARGKILVFTDSDCELDCDFLHFILASFGADDIAGAQGSYRTRQTEFMARFGQVEIETRYDYLSRNTYIDFIGTYAAAYRREVFIAHGGFDELFHLASGEDAEFSYKLQKQGHKLVFSPAAFVYHHHPTSLMQYLRVKFYRGYWRVRLYSLHPEKTIRDSYTPQSLKLQVLTVPLIAVLLLLALIHAAWLTGLATLIIGYLCWSVPFGKRFYQHGYGGIWRIPALLALRAIALAAGLTTGFLSGVNRRPIVVMGSSKKPEPG